VLRRRTSWSGRVALAHGEITRLFGEAQFGHSSVAVLRFPTNSPPGDARREGCAWSRTKPQLALRAGAVLQRRASTSPHEDYLALTGEWPRTHLRRSSSRMLNAGAALRIEGAPASSRAPAQRNGRAARDPKGGRGPRTSRRPSDCRIRTCRSCCR
jgi:hypothetical protein